MPETTDLEKFTPARDPSLPDTLTIPLRTILVTADGRELTELNLREPSAGEMLEIETLGGWAADVRAISLVAGVLERDVKTLPARELMTSANFLGSFLRNAQATANSA